MIKEFKNLKQYDGQTSKFGVTIKGVNYIVKEPKNALDSSCISEFVASNFINQMGYFPPVPISV